MSKKQLTKIIIAVFALVILVGGGIAALFLVDTESLAGGGDIEVIKANGGHEALKGDIMGFMPMRDSQVANIADGFFEDIGITKYEGMDNSGRRGNLTVYVDGGYKLDCFIKAGELANAYIGNILGYKNPDVVSITVSNAPEYSYAQYKNLVKSLARGLDVDEATAMNMYEQLTMMGIYNFTDIKSGKLNGIKGYYGYESLMKYFMVVENGAIKSITVVCEGFDPMEVYNANTPKAAYDISRVKVLQGTRQAIATVLDFKIQQQIGLDVTLPAALLNGDDSWLMVRNGDEIWLLDNNAIITKSLKDEDSAYPFKVYFRNGVKIHGTDMEEVREKSLVLQTQLAERINKLQASVKKKKDKIRYERQFKEIASTLFAFEEDSNDNEDFESENQE